VLDAVDAGGDAPLDRLHRVGVGRDGQPQPVRLGDDHPYLVDAELAGQHVGRHRHHAAADHHLDHVGTAFGAVPDGPAQVGGAGHLAAHGPAVPADAGDRRAGRHHRRPVRRRVVAVHHRETVVAEVAHRGDAGPEVRPQRGLDGGVQLGGGQVGDAVQRVRPGVAAQVHVGVDQPRQQRRARTVGHLAAVRCGGGAGLDADDDTVLDQHQRAPGHGPFAVERRIGPVGTHGCRVYGVRAGSPAAAA
jgi:hypothetical protein